MLGVQIAFRDYWPWFGLDGIFNAEWVGLLHFRNLFQGGLFTQILRNSLSISALQLAFGFPAPIILALLINEVTARKYKRTVQTITYLPFFLSWVVIYGILFNLLNTTYGTVNVLLRNLGFDAIPFLSDPDWLYPTLVFSSVWRSVGFGSIIYLAALTGIDPELYEAAHADGAGRFRMMLHITIPLLKPIAAMMLCLQIGSILSNDLQQLIVFVRSPLQERIGTTFEYHVFATGFRGGRFSYGTAVGLFQSLVGLTLVIPANAMAKKMGYLGLF